MSGDGRVHVLMLAIGDHYRNTPDGPVIRVVERSKLRFARMPDGSVIRLASTPDYTSRVIPCDENGGPP